MNSHRILAEILKGPIMALLLGSVAGAGEFLDDGELSAANEEIRWHLNRTRANPEAEADRLSLVNTTAGSNGAFDIAEDTAGVNNFGAGPAQWTVWRTPQQPLAPNRLLSQASDAHSADLSESGAFAHNSPSANYYPLGSDPFERQAQEGYENEVYGYIENLITSSLGQYGSYAEEAVSPLGAHEALFIDASIPDRGHRKTILNDDAREIGIGYASKTFQQMHSGYLFNFIQEYYTYDVGRRGIDHYFTGSIFLDADDNTYYDRGEGLDGIEIRLYQDGVENTWHDISTASGNFAVPLNELANGTVVVVLVNPGATAVNLSIPVDHVQLGEIEILAGESYLLGSFEQVDGLRNVGFRDLAPAARLDIACQTEEVSVSFNAMLGLTYTVQTSEDIVAGLWTTLHTLTADEYRETITCGTGGVPLPDFACFRVLIDQP